MKTYFGRDIYDICGFLIASVVMIGVLCMVFSCDPAHADTGTRARLVSAVLNEAENQGYEGMLAHAYMFKNRLQAGKTLGSSGIDSQRVKARLASILPKYRALAERAVSEALACSIPDPTRGATYCENVGAFGVPNHILKYHRAGRILHAVKVKDVTFWAVR